MPSITNFDAFLDNVDDSHEDVYALYRAVTDITDMGMYSCVTDSGPDTWIVRAPHIDDDLFLASQEAKDAFLRAIHARFVGDDEDGMDMEGWYQYMHAMVRDDS